MSPKPDTKPGDWITIGTGKHMDCVVCHVYNNPQLGDIEVVYLDWRDHPINEDVIWVKDHWELKHHGPGGGYADKCDRLSQFVSILRRGRY